MVNSLKSYEHYTKQPRPSFRDNWQIVKVELDGLLSHNSANWWELVCHIHGDELKMLL